MEKRKNLKKNFGEIQVRVILDEKKGGKEGVYFTQKCWHFRVKRGVFATERGGYKKLKNKNKKIQKRG